MSTPANKAQATALSKSVDRSRQPTSASDPVADLRPQAAKQQQLQAAADNSPQARQLKTIQQSMLNNGSGQVVQRVIKYNEETYGAADADAFTVAAGAKLDKIKDALRLSDEEPQNSIEDALASPHTFKVVPEEEGSDYFAVEVTKARVAGAPINVGDSPAVVNRRDGGPETLHVSGLIMCVGVFLEGATDGQIERIGALHFNASTMLAGQAINDLGKERLDLLCNMMADSGTITAKLAWVTPAAESSSMPEGQRNANTVGEYLATKGVVSNTITSGGSARTLTIQANGTANQP